MEIKGKVHCFFEQSGTFKNEFIKLGIQAEDYDIQDNFGQTDHTDDLFADIEKAYVGGGTTIFDSITCDDLIMAFFPCIHFCDAKTLYFMGVSIGQKGKPLHELMRQNIRFSKERERFFQLLMMFVAVCSERGIRLIIENPYNTSGMTYLENNFPKPTMVDRNRMIRGDYFVKPTGYWFINCTPTMGFSEQRDKKQKSIMRCKRTKGDGICSEERSMISPDYARNFICDFIIGREQTGTQLSMF